MSEPTRTIAGFGSPRPATTRGVHPDASRLLARNRGEAQTPTVETPTPPPAKVQTAAATSAKKQLNVAIPTDLRQRANATYRATAHIEGHRSFAEFVAAALEAEIHRLEADHNGGQRYPHDDSTLPTGRPLGS